ncbi:MAG: branched-chain amino acid ABC transporter permease [Nitrospinota bacterium]|nr:MAG: branched-chain amino acid ABC transporter permease [Nitrospinota bacterium]
MGTVRRKSQRSVKQRRRIDLLISLLFWGGVALLPLFITLPYWRSTLIVAMYYTLLTMGWNLLAGYTGQFSMAPAAFGMIGAYTSALLTLQEFSPLVGILGGIGVTFGVGWLLGHLCLRLRGPYFALTTLAFAEIVRLVIANEYEITRGDLGLSVPPLYQGGELPYYYTFLLICLGVQLCLYFLMQSRIGLYLQAIREDEVAAQGRGVDVVKWKTMASALSSALCGLAGALYVHFIQLASPDMGTILQTGLIISMNVIGGMGTLVGPLIGAFLVQVTAEYVREFGFYHMIIFALLMMIVVRFFREGVYGLFLRVYHG